MRLFFVLVCCLAIPLVARAADQDNNKKQKQTTQGHPEQKQTAIQTKHYGANTASRPKVNNSSQSNGQVHHALNARNNNARIVHSNTKGKVGTTHYSAKTASQLKLNNSSQSKGQ